MKPTSAPAYFPYTHHRTMAQVIKQEALDAFNRLPLDYRKGRTVSGYGKGE